MYRQLFPICFLLLLASCGVPENKIRVEGKFSGINQAEFYIYSEDNAFSGIDTVRIEDGKFSYEKEMKQAAVLTLLFPNYSETYFVAEPGKTVKIEGDAGKLSEISISGNADNEALTEFRHRQLRKPAGDTRLAAADYIRTHSGSLASVVLFKQYFIKQAPSGESPAASLLDALRKGRPNDPSLLRMESFYKPLLRNAKDKLLSSFSARTIDGETIASSRFLGKPLLVVFFASWNGESNRLLDTVRHLHRRYGDRCGFLLVSLDADQEACRRQLRADTLSLPAICDGRAFESPVVRQIGVRYVPGNLLTDAKGKILDRDIPVDELKRRIEEALK